MTTRSLIEITVSFTSNNYFSSTINILNLSVVILVSMNLSSLFDKVFSFFVLFLNYTHYFKYYEYLNHFFSIFHLFLNSIHIHIHFLKRHQQISFSLWTSPPHSPIGYIDTFSI